MKNRIAIITGAGSGIGKSTAIGLAAQGVKMILNGRNESKLKCVQGEVNEIAGAAIAHCVPGDVSDINVTDACVSACQDAWNSAPDIFVACAGRGLPGTLINSDINEWDDLINTNVKGLMYQLSSIGKTMLALAAKERDYIKYPMDIVVIGSNIGRNVSPFNSVYGATKFAAHGLTEALRRQLGPQGIRVTLLEPGIVRTGFQEAAGYSKEWFETYSKEVGPVIEAEDVAGVIIYLLQLPGNVHMDNVSIRPTRQAYP